MLCNSFLLEKSCYCDHIFKESKRNVPKSKSTKGAREFFFAFLAGNSAKGGGGVWPPSAKKCPLYFF